MNYEETIEYLFNQLAMYQRVGSSAYKPGLDTSLKLDSLFGSPAQKLKCVHIAGTNGKGSTAHTLAAILQSAGFKTGLYTSPHLVDFRERIRIDGKKIDKQRVVDFTHRFLDSDSRLKPSFFELTMTMAFEYFYDENVDLAVIETGLGGKLDSTNIITPMLSVITNISLDHTALLGKTLEAIAEQKAGIIKPGIPVVIGETTPTTRKVFVATARKTGSEITFAEDLDLIKEIKETDSWQEYSGTPFGTVRSELRGEFQAKNASTIMATILQLRKEGLIIPTAAVHEGFGHVCELTGLAGRWMKLADKPLTICDTGHNPGGWEYISRELKKLPGKKLTVLGFANDKDISGILKTISRIDNLCLFAAQASVERAMPVETLSELANNEGILTIKGGSVSEAYSKAVRAAGPDDTVFIGGSNFVVADLLDYLNS